MSKLPLPTNFFASQHLLLELYGDPTAADAVCHGMSLPLISY
ncbi:MAG: hypothetical protein VYE01_01510 [Pseudomonadota bacterium]|nr:hypothetical protein [Pseudomonadota bacterium]